MQYATWNGNNDTIQYAKDITPSFFYLQMVFAEEYCSWYSSIAEVSVLIPMQGT